jgi:2'-5' RNA ligase
MRLDDGTEPTLRDVVAAARPRRAVVLFVPPPAGPAIDEIRERWDPVMRARIGPHITLVHDVVDHARATADVAAVAAAMTRVRARLTAAAHWGQAAYGVYLGVEDPTGGIAALQAQLAALEEPRWARVPFRAHCTLVHSRTTEPTIAARAWAELDGFVAGWDVELAAIDVIELDDRAGWRTVERYDLA